jgi:hypothetical protein
MGSVNQTGRQSVFVCGLCLLVLCVSLVGFFRISVLQHALVFGFFVHLPVIIVNQHHLHHSSTDRVFLFYDVI